MEIWIMSGAFVAGLVSVLVASLVAEGWSLSMAMGNGTSRPAELTTTFTPAVSEAEVDAVFGAAS